METAGVIVYVGESVWFVHARWCDSKESAGRSPCTHEYRFEHLRHACIGTHRSAKDTSDEKWQRETDTRER